MVNSVAHFRRQFEHSFSPRLSFMEGSDRLEG